MAADARFAEHAQTHGVQKVLIDVPDLHSSSAPCRLFPAQALPSVSGVPKCNWLYIENGLTLIAQPRFSGHIGPEL